ncbi:MAG TPA: MgtC/SapB family protein [Chitinophagales bacterium]|nr:MgtC/SapB family protein [Chitinophagales bacterium]MCB9075116.1 MgtC/SapB family protein [Chitinophagales bacterium]HMU97939.1 MgtC/SapB family protein [Chitinophagales bacterium]HMV02940.1 MgtC/SapB family protein [Chitinophagales bacterium]HMW93538.1 MgtC/SapB family protein [Chitinophagales bacterium]
MLAWDEILIRLITASILGAFIGLERERKTWSAGMRTHMLVCVGSCLIMIVSAFGFQDILGKENITLDPSRIAAQVVSGIGFIGAGTILFQKQGTVKGLTTAAGLWTVAGIGLATGGGLYITAIMTTGIVLIILWILQPIEKKYIRHFVRQTLRITTDIDSKEVDILNILNENEFNIEGLNLIKSDETHILEINFEGANPEKMALLIDQLRKLDSIKEVNWSQ